jgi:hypothetical protein
MERPRYALEAQTFPVGPSPKAAQDDRVVFLQSSRPSGTRNSIQATQHFMLGFHMLRLRRVIM